MRLRVLVIEDNIVFASLLNEFLKRRECNVILTVTRDDALEAIQHGFFPDLILLDYSMPGMSADEFLKEIRLSPFLPRLILMTAEPEASSIGKRLGIAEVLEKPFDVGAALDRIGLERVNIEPAKIS